MKTILISLVSALSITLAGCDENPPSAQSLINQISDIKVPDDSKVLLHVDHFQYEFFSDFRGSFKVRVQLSDSAFTAILEQTKALKFVPLDSTTADSTMSFVNFSVPDGPDTGYVRFQRRPERLGLDETLLEILNTENKTFLVVYYL